MTARQKTSNYCRVLSLRRLNMQWISPQKKLLHIKGIKSHRMLNFRINFTVLITDRPYYCSHQQAGWVASKEKHWGVVSSWNVMAHGDALEGKWGGNCRMEWVASTLHTTSEHGVSSITTADAHNSAANSRLNWRPPADLNELANAVGSQYPSHYLRTWCIQHYYRWCAHLGCQ